jgi:outer membrane protein OmpA-like peptidoglycan-associated protein
MDEVRMNAAKELEAAKLADAQAASRNEAQARMNAQMAAADANRQRADADRTTAEAQRQQQSAVAEADRNRAIASEANQAAAEAQLALRNAEAESERNRVAAADADQRLQQAVRDREELRAKLLQQFNLIFTTRDTARGLIVSLSDVLFDTGKSALLPGAREKLAKISGIVLAYPDLRLGIEGYTDSVGSDALNQQLSQQRASSVRDYLAGQNVPAGSMTSQGFGETQPVASNDTAAGRQQNRRVELVVSGEIIGTTIGVAAQNLNLALPLR